MPRRGPLRLVSMGSRRFVSARTLGHSDPEKYGSIAYVECINVYKVLVAVILLRLIVIVGLSGKIKRTSGKARAMVEVLGTDICQDDQVFGMVAYHLKNKSWHAVDHGRSLPDVASMRGANALQRFRLRKL